jgi:hypothetical protein
MVNFTVASNTVVLHYSERDKIRTQFFLPLGINRLLVVRTVAATATASTKLYQCVHRTARSCVS